ncbi:outer membrane lipid asymmetry maintenance protein MlaD [Roseomonas elaeocarpi]|uniref:Outer membrane lipid asymmetry maintenance protein MlaD n=1 Tax=Roseomonas elaeocarpi TaxID=907779 RepID=A0ABV6JTN1_9PROT
MKGRSLAEVLAGAVVLVVAVVFLAYAANNSGKSLGTSSGINLRARFDRIDGLANGSDVRIAGVRVGSVTAERIDPRTFLAEVTMRIDSGLNLPDDSSAEITSESLLGGKYIALVPGGSDKLLKDGGEITITQSAVSLESLLGKFIFSVTQMNSNHSDDDQGNGTPAPAPARP